MSAIEIIELILTFIPRLFSAHKTADQNLTRELTLDLIRKLADKYARDRLK